VRASSFSPRATRVPQAAGTSGIQRSVTVTSRRPVGWAHGCDLGWGTRPKLHGMQGVRPDQLQRIPAGATSPSATTVGRAIARNGTLRLARSSNRTQPPAPWRQHATRGPVRVGRPGAGWLHPSSRTAPTLASAAPPTITASARPAGWKVVRYRGISFSVPASWRIRDGRKLPCPAILPGPAVVLGHSNLRAPCPMPQLRRPLLWVDDRAEEPPPAPRWRPRSTACRSGCCACTQRPLDKPSATS
jgi:hypothetical protein